MSKPFRYMTSLALAFSVGLGTAMADGVSFRSGEVGLTVNNYYFSGTSTSGSRLKAKGTWDVTGTPFFLEGRAAHDTGFFPAVNQAHVTVGMNVAPDARVGLSAGVLVPSLGGSNLQQYGLKAQAGLGNGVVLDGEVGQLINNGPGLIARFARGRIRYGNWFGKADHFDISGSYFGVASLGYSHDVGGAKIETSVGRYYSSFGTPNVMRLQIEVKIPLGRKSAGGHSKSTQGVPRPNDDGFGDFNYLDLIGLGSS